MHVGSPLRMFVPVTFSRSMLEARRAETWPHLDKAGKRVGGHGGVLQILAGLVRLLPAVHEHQDLIAAADRPQHLWQEQTLINVPAPQSHAMDVNQV